ncbi:hypothetical protein D3C85_1665120 [compost metagenome]
MACTRLHQRIDDDAEPLGVVSVLGAVDRHQDVLARRQPEARQRAAFGIDASALEPGYV